MSDREYNRKYYLANREKLLEARRKYVAENREKVLDGKREYYKKNKAKVDLTKRKWEKAHRDRINAQNRARYHKDKANGKVRKRTYNALQKARHADKARQWRMRNPTYVKQYAMRNNWRLNERCAYHRAKKLGLTVGWANRKEILRLYEVAAFMGQHTGIEHHVDHIYPLQGRGQATGLHVESNLRVIPGRENQSKANKFPCLN